MCRDKECYGSVKLVKYHQVVVHMLDGYRFTEVTSLVTVSAEGVYHTSLIIVTEESAAVLIQTYINIIIKYGHILKV